MSLKVTIANIQNEFGGQKEIEEIARMISIRSEAYGFTSQSILNFKIEQSDKEGNIINVVPVEMRRLQIIGIITDGDRV